MGGALTFLASVHVPEADTVVSWYGCPHLEYVDASKIKMPVMGHFAIEDAFFPTSQVTGLEQKLKEAGVKYEFHRYNAQHGFANETIKNPTIPIKYDQAAAETAWTRTLEFLRRTLS
jgi:carboxymethylenebutenolidase